MVHFSCTHHVFSMIVRSRIITRAKYLLSNHRYQSSYAHLVKEISVNVGADLYPKLSHKLPQLYRNIPAGGLDLKINYVDTKQDGKEYRQVVVAVHGAPDTHRTFTKLIEHYEHSDVRLVAPNLPDFTHTRKQNFWHTTEEKVEFMRNFLQLLNINTVDCLVSHSFGIQTNAGIWEKSSNVTVKSVALIAPQTLFDIPVDRLRAGQKIFLFFNERWYDFLGLVRFYKLNLFPMKFKNIDECLLLVCGAFDEQATGLTLLKDRLKQLAEMNLPTVVLFGTREPIITRKAQTQINQLLKISNVTDYDPSSDCFDQFELKNTRNSFMVQGGGHFIHSNYDNFTNKLIDELLRRVSPSPF